MNVEKKWMFAGSTYFTFSNLHSFMSFTVDGNTNFNAIKGSKKLL